MDIPFISEITIAALWVFPFSLIGLFVGLVWLKERYLISKGYYKCVFRLSNFRTKIKYMRPENNIIQDKEFKTLDFPLGAGYIFFEGDIGSKPVMEYNAARKPINFLPTLNDVKRDSATQDSLMQRVYNLGIRAGIKDLEKLKQYIIIGLILSGASLAILVLLLTGNLEVGSLAAH